MDNNAVYCATVSTGDPLAVGEAERDVVRALIVQAGLRDAWRIERLAGGVSSNVWLASGEQGALVVKQPLARLRVSEVWEAPLERSVFEHRWLSLAGGLVPHGAPEIVHFDPTTPLLVTRYLPPTTHPVWQRSLFAGTSQAAQARAVGSAMAAVHAATAGRPEFRRMFAAEAVLMCTRIEPYFLATAKRHPRVAGHLHALGHSVLEQARAVIHGDTSPKNILQGIAGPVFLDAECACYADPAFDLAFCMNHLLLKQVAMPHRRDEMRAHADCLVAGYREGIDWEPAPELLGRAALLLPALMLARVDGKVPVHYLNDEWQLRSVRSFATRHLEASTSDLDRLLASMSDDMAQTSDRIELGKNI